MIDKQFLIERNGKAFVLYAGLLDLAHGQGLKAIRTTLVQVPNETNGQIAIVAAEVETDRGTYSGIGDASPANVSRAMLTCLIRLAETRAKARALRDAVNVGVAAIEELGDEPAPEPTPIRPATARPVAHSAPVATVEDPATPAQRRAIEKLRGACPENLSKTDASALISRLQQEASAR